MLGDWEHISLKSRDNGGRDVYVCFDSDVVRKPEVQDAFDRLSALLHRRGARVGYILLPEGAHGSKVGLDDFFANGGDAPGLWALTSWERPRWLRPKDRGQQQQLSVSVPVRTLAEAEVAFRQHLYLPDLRPLHVLLGAIAANRLPGEPVWLLIVGASGSGKSELVRACNGLAEVAVVTTLSEAALLSGTSTRDTAADATGGVLRQIGSLGLLSFKDFTSTLSLDKDALAKMLSALREIYDGYWSRDVGTDGGRKLSWQGKAGMIGGVTPAIDRHHAVVAEMGERLLLFRMPTLGEGDIDRAVAQAMSNHEVLAQMRGDLRDVVAGLFAGLETPAAGAISDEERIQLVEVVKLVARGRAAVYRERGELMGAGEPEIPTRLAQQLERLLAGMVAIGLDRPLAWKATLVTALSSMPSDRWKAIDLLRKNMMMTTTHVGTGLGRPTTSIRRTLEDLEAHSLIRRHSQGSGRADVWELDDRTRESVEAIPEDVLGFYVTPPAGGRD
jgi:energy-coupling factor transporter ATP-binding protein EcfA2